MSGEQKSYRSVMKATSLFGGVQVLNILISIVRSKFIAEWLGATGMGIAGLFNATLGIVNGFTNLGLDRSAVKDIALAHEKKDPAKEAKTINVLKKLVWITGSVGAVLMLATSSFLSYLAFGNQSFTWGFVWLSLALLFNQLASSRLAILQGLRKLKDLARANLLGNFLGLVITIPLYYFWRIDAIVPAIIISSLLSFCFTYYYAGKIAIERVDLSNQKALLEGKNMIGLGVMLNLGSMISLLVAYLVQVYISVDGGVDQVGYYQAGILILNSYVGLIFNAMATDYFPRLSAIAEKHVQIRKTVLEQALIALLLITPIIVLFLVFAPSIIEILYSDEFIPVVGMVNWGILGMLFKAVSFSIGYVIIAKGDSKVFIKTSVGFNLLLLGGNILGYRYAGLEGLGFSFFVYYIVHFLALAIITFYRYRFYFKPWFYRIFAVCIILCLSAFAMTYVGDLRVKYAGLALLILISLAFSYYQLDKKLDLKELLNKIFRRKK